MKYRLTFIAIVALAQPALAKGIVIHCSGVSDMKIYNPHGKGGIIGGPSPVTWLLRTDGTHVWATSDGKTVELGGVRLSSSGLAFCDAQTPCDTITKKMGSDGWPRSLYVSSTKITTTGSIHKSASIMTDNAPMKTGVAWEDSGQCDEADIAALRNLRAGDAGSSSSDDSATSSVGSHRNDAAALVVEETKPDRPRPRQKPTTVDVYYACEARDTSGEKPIYYYSNVADIELPENFGAPDDIKIRGNWRNYIAKATGATESPTCAPLSFHSMDEALRKQREIVSNRSVYNETVSVSYDPHL